MRPSPAGTERDHRTFREALLALPAEEYDWYDVAGRERRAERPAAPGMGLDGAAEAGTAPEDGEEGSWRAAGNVILVW